MSGRGEQTASDDWGGGGLKWPRSYTELACGRLGAISATQTGPARPDMAAGHEMGAVSMKWAPIPIIPHRRLPGVAPRAPNQGVITILMRLD